MNDLQLQQRVIDALTMETNLESEHIGVFVHDGVVTLTGFVSDYAEKHAAEQLARRVPGVRALAQELTVRSATDKKWRDDEIAARAARLLQWELALPDGTVGITVEDGVVILSGSVPFDYQRRFAERDVGRLGGVSTVINQLKLQPGAAERRNAAAPRLRQLAARSAELSERLQRVQRDLRHAVTPLEADFAEQAVQRENDEVLERIEASTREQLAAVRHAIHRLQEGHGDHCEACGRTIDDERLQAVPEATRCRFCL